MTNFESNQQFPAAGPVGFSHEGMIMTAVQSHPRAPRARRSAQRRPVETELRAQFEREAIPLRDAL
jgi:hypothetical protein